MKKKKKTSWRKQKLDLLKQAYRDLERSKFLSKLPVARRNTIKMWEVDKSLKLLRETKKEE